MEGTSALREPRYTVGDVVKGSLGGYEYTGQVVEMAWNRLDKTWCVAFNDSAGVRHQLYEENITLIHRAYSQRYIDTQWHQFLGLPLELL